MLQNVLSLLRQRVRFNFRCKIRTRHILSLPVYLPISSQQVFLMCYIAYIYNYAVSESAF